MKLKTKTIVKLLVSILILAVLFSSVNVDELKTVVSQANVWLLLLALGLVLSIRGIMALRWQIVLRLYGRFPKFLNLLSIVFMSNSIGHLLPGGGVDVVRSYQLAKDEGVVTEVAASVFVDRVVGLFSMLLIAFVASIVAVYTSDLSQVYVYVVSVMLVGFSVLYFLRGILNGVKFDELTSIKPLKKLLVAIGKFVVLLGNVPLPGSVVLKLLLLSFLVQFIRILIFYSIFTALGIHLDLALFVVFVPLLFIVMLMPISIGGLGVREGALFLFLSPYGASLEVCTAAGLLFHLLQLISMLPGIVLFMLRK